jgi:hypothetical protein
MKLFKVLVALAILSGSLLSISTTSAKSEYARKEGKNCKYCHSAMPPKADNLNDVGKCYKANDHSLAKCAAPSSN